MKLQLEKFIEENKKQIESLLWEDTIKTYKKNIIKSNQILDVIENIKEYSNVYDNIKKINNKIESYIFNSLNPNYQIAIIGSIKAGKSTLINAVLGIELASVNVTPETATLTKFKSSIKNSINVVFYKKNEWNEIWNNANKKNAEIFIKEYNDLKSDNVKNQFLDKEELYLEFNNIESLKNEVLKWTSSQSPMHYFVKQIEIGVENLDLPEKVVLVDTPGLNDIIDYRSKITRDYIDSANSIIICVNSKTLRNDEMNTIKEVFNQARYKKDKIFVLGTQIDIMNSINDWELQKKDWLKNLSIDMCYENIENAEKKLLAVSSFAYNYATLMNDNITVKELLEILKLKLINDDVTEIIKNLKNNEVLDKNESLRIKKLLIELSGIENVKNNIKNSIVADFKESLIEDFIEKYKIINSDLIDLLLDFKKSINDIKVKGKSNELIQSINKSKKILNKNKNIVSKIENNIDMKYEARIDVKKIENDFQKLRNRIEKI